MLQMRIQIFILSVLALTSVVGQESRVLVRNNPENDDTSTSIQIKWYSNEFPFYTEGCHVYRRRSGTVNWEKITSEPIAQDVDFDTTLYYQQDPDLGFYTEIVKGTTLEQLEESGFLFINILVKSFESQLFTEFIGNFYVDNTVSQGVSYEYKINKITNGRELYLGQSKTIRAGTYQPEKTVSGFSVEQQDTTFTLDWEVDPELFYAVNVYQYSDSLGEIRVNENPLMMSETTDSLGNVGYASPKYTIRDLTVGQTYVYTISGKDFFGSETARSEEIVIELEDTTPPPPPINFEGKADSMKVHLKWEFEKTSDFEELRLYRSPVSDGPFEIIHKTTTESSYTDSLSIPGPYYYIIANTDVYGNEGESRKIFIEVQDVFPPMAPQGLTIKSDTGKIFIEWEANLESDLEGYLVYRTVEKDNKKKYVLLNSDPLKTTSLEQPFPKQVKSTFFYYVVAIDTVYNRSNPSEFVSAQLPDVIPPERPFIKHLSYQEGNGMIIEWIANSDADLKGYELMRLDSLGAILKKVNSELISKDLTKFTDQSLISTEELYYQLIAIDSSENKSEPSLPFGITYQSKKESESSSFSVKATSVKKGKRITLKWLENSENLLGYVLFIGPDAESLKPATGIFKESYIRLNSDLLENELAQIRMYKTSGKLSKSNIIDLSDYR